MSEEIKELTKVSKEIIQSIVLNGDISKLSQQQKLEYYAAMCERLGLDPMTQPFQIIKFMSQGNKEVLYCTKGGAEQLNKKYNVSQELVSEEEKDGLYIVKARAKLLDGRFVDDMGIVDLGAKTGDLRLNLMLKAVTKAKRRATLSLLGLGMLDETEVETIPDVKVIDIAKKVESSPKETNGESKISPTSSNGSGKATNGLGESICANCGLVVKSKIVARKSQEEFGKILCWNHENGGCQEIVRNTKKLEADAEYEFLELGEPEEVI